MGRYSNKISLHISMYSKALQDVGVPKYVRHADLANSLRTLLVTFSPQPQQGGRVKLQYTMGFRVLVRD